MPGAGAGVPDRAVVGVGHEGFGGLAGRRLQRGQDVDRVAAVDADRDDLRGRGGECEGLAEGLSGPRAAVGHRVREPGGCAGLGEDGEQRLGLVAVRDGLHGQDVGAGGEQGLDAGAVEGGELAHAQPVPAAVLGAVREHRPVRAHGGGHPHLVVGGLGRPGGQVHAAVQQGGGSGAVVAVGGEGLVTDLVTGRDQYLGAGPGVRRVGGRHLVRALGEHPARPEVAGQVAALGGELVAEPAVEE